MLVKNTQRIFVWMMLFALVASQSFAMAAPVNKKRQKRQLKLAVKYGQKLVEAAQDFTTRSYVRYQETSKAFDEAVKSKQAELNAKEKELVQSVKFLQEELTKSINELYSVDTEIAIIPQIVGINQQLLALTEKYKEQAGFFLGSETLPCGRGCVFFQRKREAISKMIAQLATDLLDVGAIVDQRRKKVLEFVGELRSIRSGSGSGLTRFGLDYFVNQRLSVIENQDTILEDVSAITTLTYIDGAEGRVEGACRPGQYTYGSLISDLAYLWLLTRNYQYSDPEKGRDPLLLYSAAKWADAIPKQIFTDRYRGVVRERIYYPGWLDNWRGCFQTKTNIYNDFKSKVAAEIKLGNLEAAQELDEETQRLAIEIDRLKGQEQRIEQAIKRIEEVRGIAVAFAFPPENSFPHTDEWKTAVFAQVNNLSRLFEVEREVLLAARALLQRVESEFIPLGGAARPEELNSRLFSIEKRLETIASNGFDRLIEELRLATDTMQVMSTNIRGGEGVNGQGYLGEAILGYEEIVRIRTNQMLRERDVELPQRREVAQAKVDSLQADLESASAILEETRAKQKRLGSILDLAKEHKELLENFFSVKVAHPFFVNLVRKYDSELQGIRGYKRSILNNLNKFLESAATVKPEQAQLRVGVPRRRSPSLAKSAKVAQSMLVSRLSQELDSSWKLVSTIEALRSDVDRVRGL